MHVPKYISLKQMEKLTEKICLDYGFDPYEKTVRSVPIEELVEFHFDLQICWESIDHFDPSGIVMAAILPADSLIILNESQRDLFESKIGTYHFTLAHELGHWVLHTGKSSYFLRNGGTKSYICRTYAKKPPEEIQADLFAGCLLMPRPMMECAVNQLTKLGLIQLTHLYGLAQTIGVSITALQVRLSQLNLLLLNKDGTVKQPNRNDTRDYEQISFLL